MELTDFHTIRTAIQTNAVLPTQVAITSLEGELRAELTASGLFESVEVGTTDNQDAFVIALCQFRPDLDAAELAKTLEGIWHDAVSYPFWEAHSMIVDAEHVELQGATRVGVDGHYATLHVVAQRAQIPQQHEPSSGSSSHASSEPRSNR